MALDTTVNLLNFVSDDTTSWETHGAYVRAKNIYDSLGTVSDNVTNVAGSVANVGSSVANVGDSVTNVGNSVIETKALVEDVQAQLKAARLQIADLGQRLTADRGLLLQIIQLLLTPDGRRAVPAKLLTCTGDTSTSQPCPLVPIVCSPTTGLCTFNQ